jgi:hypothetical protein
MMKCIESVQRAFKQLILARALALRLQPRLQTQPSLTQQTQPSTFPRSGLPQKASLPMG